MITHLARISLFEQSRLTRIILQMEERGLVRRQSDPRDGRRVRVFLSPGGRALADALVPRAKAHEAELLDLLGPADREVLKPILKKLLARLEDEAP